MKFESLFSSIKTALVAVFLCVAFAITAGTLTACSSLELVSDYVSDNPLLAQVATRQAVAQYISDGETIEDEIERAQQVKKRIAKVLLFVDEESSASVSQLMTVIDSSIEWDELTYQDRLLVQDIVSLVEIELQSATEPIITESTKLVLRTLFETALSAASLYLRR